MSDCLAYIMKDKIEVLNLKNNEIASGTANFSTNRLLLGDFCSAETLLKSLLKKVNSNLSIFKPRLIIQPLEMVEGGLCPVEERAFMELGQSAGARKVILHLDEKRVTKDKAFSLF